MEAVLNGIDAKTAEKIYADKTYGMDQAYKLYYWTKALEGAEEAYYNILMSYHGLTTAQMTNIVGPKSILKQIDVSAHYNLKEQLGIKGHESISGDMLFDRQWGSMEITSSPSYYINPMQTGFKSIYYLALDTIHYIPEVAAYSEIVMEKPFVPISSENVASLFKQSSSA
jgi:hypothetical protein